ncbi:hypothetical protein BD324DRAFT_528327 [Kockovaella imperatae]|uniref:Uncharacterized protein n=1 Tax=Kockovaella imperatae TaxID=4999 RepID=A0A1Y1UF56_9TREE|nr:hypothetical protein BD324DRAFT_528327 [Kockovaella imperatae]ORX36167.1 hypothetical protein BD324DRAFT_528327 [Kockovaella imperatae]
MTDHDLSHFVVNTRHRPEDPKDSRFRYKLLDMCIPVAAKLGLAKAKSCIEVYSIAADGSSTLLDPPASVSGAYGARRTSKPSDSAASVLATRDEAPLSKLPPMPPKKCSSKSGALISGLALSEPLVNCSLSNLNSRASIVPITLERSSSKSEAPSSSSSGGCIDVSGSLSASLITTVGPEVVTIVRPSYFRSLFLGFAVKGRAGRPPWWLLSSPCSSSTSIKDRLLPLEHCERVSVGLSGARIEEADVRCS